MKKVSGPEVVTGVKASEMPLPAEIQEAMGELVGAADEDVSHEELQDPCLLVGVHVVQAVGEAIGEALDGLGELEVVGGVVDLGFDRVSLGTQGRFAAP